MATYQCSECDVISDLADLIDHGGHSQGRYLALLPYLLCQNPLCRVWCFGTDQRGQVPSIQNPHGIEFFSQEDKCPVCEHPSLFEPSDHASAWRAGFSAKGRCRIYYCRFPSVVSNPRFQEWSKKTGKSEGVYGSQLGGREGSSDPYRDEE